jgi:hypothetical protein
VSSGLGHIESFTYTMAHDSLPTDGLDRPSPLDLSPGREAKGPEFTFPLSWWWKPTPDPIRTSLGLVDFV